MNNVEHSIGYLLRKIDSLERIIGNIGTWNERCEPSDFRRHMITMEIEKYNKLAVCRRVM